MVLEKAQAFGLAPLLGSSPGVGAVGYTLGGGLGWLARKYGLAADSVHSFEVVTAEGRRLRASQTENGELFWALRGGGGSFAIVTGMKIQLYPVATVFGGNLVYPIELAKEVITRYREWIASAPEELTSSIVIMNFPPVPDVPELLRGKSAVLVRGCYSGPVEQGEALLRYWLDWKAPIANMFRAMPFAEVATISNDPKDPASGYSTGVWLRELSDEAIDTLIQYGVSRAGSSPLVVTEMRHVGGAFSRIDKHANAFGNRDAQLLLELIGATPTAEARRHVEQYMGQFQRELQPHMTGGVYMNFLSGKEARERVKDAYLPESYRRLKALKAQYDPDNRFQFSFNIPPVKEA
jgi:FAD/FMN-containing dehydrogenase